MENWFKASVSYNDLKGSVAADKADRGLLTKWLNDKQLLKNGEYVLGIRMSVGENHGNHQDPVYVSFFVSDLKGFNDIPEMLESFEDSVELREISVDMKITEFLALFKRFEVTLSPKAMLEGKTITT